MSGAAKKLEDQQTWTKLLVVGVGGQGVLTVARMIGEAALRAGLSPRVGQLHGMAQRGGSVEATVLLDQGRSSFIEEGGADLVLGFEPLEVLRALPRMNNATQVVVNQGKVVPFLLSMAGEDYPPVDQLLDQMRAVTPSVLAVEGTALAEQAGNPRSLNIVMLGLLAGLGRLPFSAEQLWQVIEQGTKPRFIEVNRKAFDLGRQAARTSIPNVI